MTMTVEDLFGIIGKLYAELSLLRTRHEALMRRIVELETGRSSSQPPAPPQKD